MLRSFFLFLFLALTSVVSQAQEIEVCKTCEVKTIQAAVDMAEDGDILRIKSGTYKEHDISIIDKSLTIIGEGLPVIDAEMEGTAISIRAENFSIEGLKIINVGRSHTNDFAGILVSNSKNFEVKNNRLDQVFFGILLERSSEGTVSGNIITSNAKSQSTSGNGVHIWKSEEITVKNNEIIGLRDGI